jgi:hypothetical protein
VLVFLDFDGVLRGKASPLMEFDSDCLGLFEEVMRAMGSRTTTSSRAEMPGRTSRAIGPVFDNIERLVPDRRRRKTMNKFAWLLPWLIAVSMSGAIAKAKPHHEKKAAPERINQENFEPLYRSAIKLRVALSDSSSTVADVERLIRDFDLEHEVAQKKAKTPTESKFLLACTFASIHAHDFNLMNDIHRMSSPHASDQDDRRDLVKELYRATNIYDGIVVPEFDENSPRDPVKPR